MHKPQSETLQAIDALPTDKAVTGRPTTYTDSVGAYICGRIAEGETLSAICRTPGLPARQTVHQWRRANPQFSADYRLARVDQMEGWGDEVLEIADDDTLDTMESVNNQGHKVQVANHANVQRDRLRVDTRKFIMAKIAPRIYGDKVSHEHSGEVHQRHTVELSDRERMRRLASFMLQDQANPVIEGELTSPGQPASSTVAGDVAEHHASMVPAKPASLSPADIIQGANSPAQEPDDSQ